MRDLARRGRFRLDSSRETAQFQAVAPPSGQLTPPEVAISWHQPSETESDEGCGEQNRRTREKPQPSFRGRD